MKKNTVIISIVIAFLFFGCKKEECVINVSVPEKENAFVMYNNKEPWVLNGSAGSGDDFIKGTIGVSFVKGEIGLVTEVLSFSFMPRKEGLYDYTTFHALPSQGFPDKIGTINYRKVDDDVTLGYYKLIEEDKSNYVNLESITNNSVEGTFNLSFVKTKGVGADTVRFTYGRFYVPIRQ